jgi:hypothetical protein
MNDPPANHLTALTRQQVIDLYFMEHRAKLLDVAAFFDRIDRAPPSPAPPSSVSDDFRVLALRRAISILIDGRPARAARILELMSDPTTAPIAKAPAKGASGVWPGFAEAAEERRAESRP